MDTLILNAPAKPVIPAAYVLHYYTTRCVACGAVGNGSDFYALTHLRSRNHTGTARQLDRCKAPLYNVPVERIHVGTKVTAFCAECPTIDLSHLPPPPSAAHLHDLTEPAPREPRHTKPAAPPPVPPAARPHAAKPPAKPAKPSLEDLA